MAEPICWPVAPNHPGSAGVVEPEDLRPAGIRIGASGPDVPRVASVAVRGKQVTLVADQLHDRAAAHAMPILVDRTGLERLIPAGSALFPAWAQPDRSFEFILGCKGMQVLPDWVIASDAEI